MPEGLVVYRFSAFEFDLESRNLSRADSRVPLSAPQAAILAHLLSHAGSLVSKDALTEAGWPGLIVGENSLSQAIHRLRKVLGTDPVYIENVPFQGYRFVLPVERAVREVAAGSIEAGLEPFLTLVRRRTRLETLDRDAILEGRDALDTVVRRAPDHAPAHVLFALASGLAFELSATDSRRDTEALHKGIFHARRACELAPESGEAWSTLAFVLGLTGTSDAAAAAACRAMTLEPENWRHALQLAKVTWGQERVHAARRALTLQPGLALAHWLRATVFIARAAFDMAVDEIRPGCAAQDAQADGAAFPAVGLHLLHGLVLAAHGRLDAAVEELDRELASTRRQLGTTRESANQRQMYARICAANAWYALGALLLRQRKRTDADAAFACALGINPQHVPATAALIGEVPSVATGINAAIGRAIVLARGNRHDEAARVFREGLAHAPPGHDGWILPVEPMLNAMGHRDNWDEVLSRVRMRAS